MLAIALQFWLFCDDSHDPAATVFNTELHVYIFLQFYFAALDTRRYASGTFENVLFICGRKDTFKILIQCMPLNDLGAGVGGDLLFMC
jgi:hypothetical protein